jgi:8-oxo-dGTP pyrophosphatase MutT (NUDIX family)
MPMTSEGLHALLEGYFKVFPDDKSGLELLSDQVADGEQLNTRKNFRGHITGAGIVLSPDRTKVLLIHHNFLNLWLQPGGHWDPDEADPLEAAKREVAEETGVSIARYLPVDKQNPLMPIQIDTHAIPTNPDKHEPAHYHHDFRYVFEAANESLVHQPEEVGAARWFPLNAPEAANISEALSRVRSRMPDLSS